MAYSITLTPYTPEIIKFKGVDSFRVRIVATAATDMPKEVFGHQKTLVDPLTNTSTDEFCFVCSPYDLSAYPANTPDDEQSPQYFRKDTVDILVPGVEMAQEVINQVLEQVQHLVTLLKKLDELDALTPTVIT